MDDVSLSSIESTLFGRRSAVFSNCSMYRYRLDRVWDNARPPLAFGMLNPSTADHERNDATIERCERRARALGFGSLIVWNLFAFRSTTPAALKVQLDPIGPKNDMFVREALAECKRSNGTVIAGWGTHGVLRERCYQVARIAKELDINLLCLGVTSSGQ